MREGGDRNRIEGSGGKEDGGGDRNRIEGSGGKEDGRGD